MQQKAKDDIVELKYVVMYMKLARTACEIPLHNPR